MKKYSGAVKAPKGVYLNLSSLEFVQQPDDGSVLPGTRDASYYKVPAGLAVVTGPLAGLVFLVFLPFIGIAGFIGCFPGPD